VQGFVRVPLNDLDAVRQIAAHNKNVVAVFVEPIQGEGGINVSRLEYLRGLKEICDQKEWLFISDEVQCGLGRTGKWFVYQHAGFQPDVVPLAKGMGSGVPVGACVVGNRAKGVFKPGNHGSTFGGNPLAMAAVRAVLGVVNDPGFLEEVRVKGAILKNALEKLAEQIPGAEVRGEGLLIGLDLADAERAKDIFEHCLREGLLVNVAGGTVVRIAPPLTVTRTEVRAALDTFRGAIESMSKAGARSGSVAVA